MTRFWVRARHLAHDRRVLGIALAAGVLIAAGELATSPMARLDRHLLDFRVFWCAGQTALAGGDPYLTEPLRSCEHRHAAGPLAASPNLVMPFALPPYDVPVLAALAREPFEAAGLLFTAASVLALAAGVALVSASARVPIGLCAAGLCMSAGLPSIVLGQWAPFELLAVSATAFALSRNRDALAGACAVATLFAPHVGTFVVAGVAVLVPRARLALGIGIAVLATVTVLTGTGSSYLTTIPLHAAAEARSAEQYSLTFLLASAGTPVGLALALGTLSSCAALAAAVLLANSGRNAGSRSAVAFVPAAFAALGGTFLHITQMALVVPAALLLFRHGQSRTARALGGLAVILLAIPWPYPVYVKHSLALTLVVLVVTTYAVLGGRLRIVMALAAACWLVLIPIENRPPPAPPPPMVARSLGTAPASLSW